MREIRIVMFHIIIALCITACSFQIKNVENCNERDSITPTFPLISDVIQTEEFVYLNTSLTTIIEYQLTVPMIDAEIIEFYDNAGAICEIQPARNFYSCEGLAQPFGQYTVTPSDSPTNDEYNEYRVVLRWDHCSANWRESEFSD